MLAKRHTVIRRHPHRIVAPDPGRAVCAEGDVVNAKLSNARDLRPRHAAVSGPEQPAICASPRRDSGQHHVCVHWGNVDVLDVAAEGAERTPLRERRPGCGQQYKDKSRQTFHNNRTSCGDKNLLFLSPLTAPRRKNCIFGKTHNSRSLAE